MELSEAQDEVPGATKRIVLTSSRLKNSPNVALASLMEDELLELQGYVLELSLTQGCVGPTIVLDVRSQSER